MMADGTKIGFIAERVVNEAGKPAVCVRVRMLNSTRSTGEAAATGAERFVRTGGTGSNELPVVLNQVRHSKLTDRSSHTGFDYTLPFRLARGHGFPYVLSFELERERSLT